LRELPWASHSISQSFLKILTIIFTLILAPHCFAAQIIVAWDKNSETDIAGYKVHYGTTSGNYECSVDVGNTISCSISGLTEGTTYYLAATAYNTNNVESSFSEELVHTVESAKTNTPPTVSITSPANGDSFDSGAIISFDGTASDNEDGVLTGGIVWISDLQGQIATVGSFTAVLSDGTHTIKAEVTDSDGSATSESVTITVGSGNDEEQIATVDSSTAVLSDSTNTITAEVTDSGDSTASDSTAITVGSGNDGGFTLSVYAYKIKGKKYADLSWSGATSTNVNVYRDGGQIATTGNDGAYTHGPFSKGKPATYQVCEAGTSICSNTVSVSW
jgi:hypothetical protein